MTRNYEYIDDGSTLVDMDRLEKLGDNDTAPDSAFHERLFEAPCVSDDFLALFIRDGEWNDTPIGYISDNTVHLNVQHLDRERIVWAIDILREKFSTVVDD